MREVLCPPSGGGLTYSSDNDDMGSLSDLLAIDTHLLLAGGSTDSDDVPFGCDGSPDDQMTSFISDLDFDAEFLQASLGSDTHSMEMRDYASTHSSDSGKHSPSGSESLSSEQHSPWVFPTDASASHHYGSMAQPSPQIYPSTSNAQAFFPHYSPNPQMPPIDSRFEQQQHAYCNQQTFSSEYQQPNAAVARPTPQNAKVLYVLPTSNAPSTTHMPSRTGSVTFSPIVKPEPPATPQPIYISSTGVPLKPISLIHAPKTLITTAGNFRYLDPVDEEYRRKQEDRKMKNRAAAQASRIKKKSELDEMKATVDNLELENSRLRSENDQLRECLRKYEAHSPSWSGSPARKRAAVAGACVMALFLMVTVSPIDLNRSPSSVNYAPAKTSVPMKHQAPHGRVLPMDAMNPVSKFNGTSCGGKKGWMNKTETIRLNNDLYDWVDRHEKMDVDLRTGKRVLLRNGNRVWAAAAGVARVNVTENRRTVAEKREDSRQRAIRERAWRHLDLISQAGESLKDKRDRERQQLKLERRLSSQTPPSRAQYDQLATSIQQRPDTLYVVTMKDYFLLPALERNGTTRPRLTLILPALSFNGTIADQIPMMRIDLDVVGTDLFNLSRQFLPLFFS